MFIKAVESNGEWSVCCEQGQPCYTELTTGACLVTAPSRGIALCLPDGTRIRVARSGARWAFLHIRGKSQPSPLLTEEVAGFLDPLYECPWASYYCK